MADFEPALAELLGIEGPRSNHPKDRGGDTAWGISKKYHPEMWRNGPPTREEACRFYRSGFWDALRLGDLSDQTLAGMVFEFAVNSGLVTAGRAVQTGYNGSRPLGFAPLKQDGRIGPLTVNALNLMCRAGDSDILKMAVLARICQHYEDLILSDPTQKEFWRGWLRRMWVTE